METILRDEDEINDGKKKKRKRSGRNSSGTVGGRKEISPLESSETNGWMEMLVLKPLRRTSVWSRRK